MSPPTTFRAIGLLAVLSAFGPERVRAEAGSLLNRPQTTDPTGIRVTGSYPAQNRVEPVTAIPWRKYKEINHFAAAPGVDTAGRGLRTIWAAA